MKFELKVVSFDIRVVLTYHAQCLNYFLNPHNRYRCADHVKYCPDYLGQYIDWL
jgi:hypothetical protein